MLFNATHRKTSSLIGSIFLSLISLGLLLVAIFPTNERGALNTIQSIMHDIGAGMVVLSFTTAVFAYAIRFKNDHYWNKYFYYTLITGIISTILIILSLITSINLMWEGLVQRISVIIGLIWIIIISLRLLLICLSQLRARSKIDENI
jgi:hypothetical protein